MLTNIGYTSLLGTAIRLPSLGTTINEVLLTGTAILSAYTLSIEAISLLSTHGGVEEEEGHVGLLLGLGESLQGDEVLLLPVEELGVHVGAEY